MKLNLFNADADIYKQNKYIKPQISMDSNIDNVSKKSTTTINSTTAKTFSILLPPPNITGSLHLGHALACSIQDALCRWERMNGSLVTWVPGCDHAGIATQVVVEKDVMKRTGKKRMQLGRQEFVKEVWSWKEQYGDRIFEQMKRLGCSLDWSRSVFTLDERLSRATKEAFILLYREGDVYRGVRGVHWCCALQSVLSDVEVENIQLEGLTKLTIPNYTHPVTFGTITTFNYPLSHSGDFVPVATTRLETMLGDTALAVHPEDLRYSHLIGQTVINPLTNHILPIIADLSVDPSFGTGAVKITPAHDANDFDTAQRHKLAFLEVIDESGGMKNVPEKFVGMPRFEARTVVQEDLKRLNLLQDVKSHRMTLPRCSRSNEVIEFKVMPQWFVRYEEMAEKALEAVESGRLQLIPDTYNKEWKRWLEKPTDWCISRQLWWGHQIPAYQVIMNKTKTSNDSNNNPNAINNTGNHNMTDMFVVGIDENDAEMEAIKLHGLKKGEFSLKQDEDVLDTWFSSALLPFSVFGWPQQTVDLTKLFPTDLLETASDIMFFWVARMVMLSDRLMGQIPFKKVLFHSVIQDGKGRKMSKSLGNVIDPMHVIEGVTLEKLIENLQTSNLSKGEIKTATSNLKRDFPMGISKCGADALRFSLCSYNFFGHFSNVDMDRFKQSSTFANKIWNSFKFYSNIMQQPSSSFSPLFFTSVLLQLTQTKLTQNHNYQQKNSTQHQSFQQQQTSAQLDLMDAWVLIRLVEVVKKVGNGFETQQLFEACRALEEFWRLDFCNVYLESFKFKSKNQNISSISMNTDATPSHPKQTLTSNYFSSNSCISMTALNRIPSTTYESSLSASLAVLHHCYDTFFKLMHPFMPFITEHLYQQLISIQQQYLNPHQQSDPSIQPQPTINSEALNNTTSSPVDPFFPVTISLQDFPKTEMEKGIKDKLIERMEDSIKEMSKECEEEEVVKGKTKTRINLTQTMLDKMMNDFK